jgi:hypothetical protein
MPNTIRLPRVFNEKMHLRLILGAKGLPEVAQLAFIIRDCLKFIAHVVTL